MSLLKNLTSDSSIANETDSLGGGGVLNSNIYLSTLKLAYITVASSEALGLVVHATTEQGKEVRETLWMTSGKAKGAKNYYEKDGEKFYLPGYLMANSIALLTTGKEISELDTEEKVIKLWNKEAKGEVPTKVNVVMELLDKQVYLGVIKEIVDKQTKDGAGDYVPTGETREQNTIDKVFRASDKMTTAEIRAQETEAAFFDSWLAKWKDQVRDKSKKQAAPKSGGFSAVAANQPAKKPTASLFAST